MNFGYTQVLFVGSVPRINCLPIFKSIFQETNKGVSLLLSNYLILSKSSYILTFATGNSKAAQGLLVYLEVNSICTAIPISLRQSSRQLLYRYVIHAGPHLTAKVFRYLRTLIDKAAIYRGILRYLSYILRYIRYPADIGQTSHSIL